MQVLPKLEAISTSGAEHLIAMKKLILVKKVKKFHLMLSPKKYDSTKHNLFTCAKNFIYIGIS